MRTLNKIPPLIIALLLSILGGTVSGHQEKPDFRGQGELHTPPRDGPRFELPLPGTYRLPVVQQAADGEVLDADGKRHRLFDLMGGKYVLLSFIYTGCADPGGCPLAVFMLNEIRLTMEEDPDLSRRVLLLTLSFDPEHDRPEVMRDFAKTYGFEEARASNRWRFLTTSSKKSLEPILDGYGQYVVPEFDRSGKTTGRYSHVLKVFLVDPEGRVRNVYSTSFLYKELISRDIKTLILENDGTR